MPLPPIRYKLHPKQQQINAEKERRLAELQNVYSKEAQQLEHLKGERRTYMSRNKEVIAQKKEEILEKKIVQVSRGRQQEKERQERINSWRENRIQQIRAERCGLIGAAREKYAEMVSRIREVNSYDKPSEHDLLKLVARLAEPQLEEVQFYDSNEGTCVICLSAPAVMLMPACRHLVGCAGCAFILKLHGKCPVCRKVSKPRLIAKL